MNLTFGKRKKTVVCLGLFDGMHLGHQKVVSKAREIAENSGEQLVCVTFCGDLKGQLNVGEGKVLYSDKERFTALKENGVDKIYALKPNELTLNMYAKEFLALINKKYDITTYVCGSDYRFGFEGHGSVALLEKYALRNNQQVVVIDQVTSKNVKISSRDIKQMILSGDVEGANELLSEPFYYTGKVVKGDKLGRLLGFPTANLYIDKDKIRLPNGVYYGKMDLNGSLFRVMLNFGFQPTFNSKKYKIEAHLIGFSGNLYGEKCKVSIVKKMRDTIKFNSVDDLIKQLQNDKKAIWEGRYD